MRQDHDSDQPAILTAMGFILRQRTASTHVMDRTCARICARDAPDCGEAEETLEASTQIRAVHRPCSSRRRRPHPTAEMYVVRHNPATTSQRSMTRTDI